MENINLNTTVNEEESVRGKLVFSYPIAKGLIRAGFKVIDLKENRENHQPILVFEDSLDMRDTMQAIVKERRKARAERAKATETAGDDEREPILQED